MIFLRMVNGLRYYPVANAGAQPFRTPLFKTKLGRLLRLRSVKWIGRFVGDAEKIAASPP
jgi:hypothetical protein